MKADRTRKMRPHIKLPVMHAWYLTYQAWVEGKTVTDVISRLLSEKIAVEVADLSVQDRRLLEMSAPNWFAYDRYTEPMASDGSGPASKRMAEP